MQRPLTKPPVHEISWTGILRSCSEAYLWLSTWAERNVEAGEDGQHRPANVRRILENRTYYV